MRYCVLLLELHRCDRRTLLFAVGKLGIFLRVKSCKESTSMSVFYSWASVTNASPNDAPATSSFWMVAASEDAFVACSNPWPQILHSLSYVDGNMATKPHHPSRVYTGFSAFLFCCVQASSSLMPHLIILLMVWTALQNKQSSEDCAGI